MRLRDVDELGNRHNRTGRGAGRCTTPTYASGKSSWDKLVLESGLSNTAKGSNLKSYNGSAAANLPIAGNF